MVKGQFGLLFSILRTSSTSFLYGLLQKENIQLFVPGQKVDPIVIKKFLCSHHASRRANLVLKLRIYDSQVVHGFLLQSFSFFFNKAEKF